MLSKITGQRPQHHLRNLQRATAGPTVQGPKKKTSLLKELMASSPRLTIGLMLGAGMLIVLGMEGLSEVLQRPKDQEHIISGTGEIKSLDAVKRQVCLRNFSDISIRNARTNSYWAAEETRSLSNAPFCFHNIPESLLDKITEQANQTQGQASMFFFGKFRTSSETKLSSASPGPELMGFRMNHFPQPGQTVEK